MELIIGALVFAAGYLTCFFTTQKPMPKEFDSKYRDKSSGLYAPVKVGGKRAKSNQEDLE